MKISDLKYTLAYLGPLASFISIKYGGSWSFAVVALEFMLIPLVELFLPANPENHTFEEEVQRSNDRFFDALLYLNLPILYGLLVYYFFHLSSWEWATYEIIGITIGMGMQMGTLGINVAHELGHRKNKVENWIAKALLLPTFYMHFNIEHNRGHHLNVATPEDPSSARFKESIYTFYFRSIFGAYRSAWKIEGKRLEDNGLFFYSWNNEMIRFHFFELIYAGTIYFLFDIKILLFAILIGVIGFLLLESVNYIEHYGLRRNKLPSGRYEIVEKRHSWNSNHELGRIFLYDLTRHADHHYKSTRKYQILRHFDESPQLPTGYPGSIILALLPPIWFRVMDPKVISWNKK